MVKYLVLCMLIFLLRCVKSQTDFPEFDPDVLLSKIQNLTVDGLKYKKIQNHFDSLRYSQTHLNGEHLLNSLVKSFGSKFGDRVVAVRRLRDAVLDSYDEKNFPVQTCCSFDSRKEISYDPQFNTKTATSQYCEQISSSSPNKTVHLNNKFLQTCKENSQHLPSIKWQYFGSEQGVTSVFPADPTDDCNSYDNRIRPWYVEANVPTPKHLVLVVDISKSMRTSSANGVVLMQLAQQAVKTVINTLNAKDSFAVLGFSDTTHTVPSKGYDPCFADILAKATTRNKKKVSAFVESLSAGGATSYKPALEKAFTYFDNEQNSSSEVDRIILFISDGEPKESEEEILNVIKNRNSAFNNSVVLMTYGLGNASFDILKKMSSLSVQSTKFEENQAFTHIKNPSNLRNQMATYYNFFALAGHATNDPIWTVPYRDAWGLGLIITGSLPVYSGGKLIGVVAVDVTVEELLTESIHFRPNQLSYSFVINDAGLVISHPLLPNHIEDDSLFIPATALERDKEFLSVFKSLRNGGSGNKTFLSTRYLPLGDNKYGVKELSVLSTYYWSVVPNSKFSICLVLQSDQRSILSDQGFSLKQSLLHRDWLFSPPQTTCSHLNTFCTKETSTVFFGNVADGNLTNENLHLFYNKNPDKYEASIENGIMNLIDATEPAETYWKNMDMALQSEIVWVYVATNEGLVRVFPGTQLPGNFDSTLRPWFRHSIAHVNKHVVTSPYKDVVTGLPVVTFGRALFKGGKANETTTQREVCGVMAVDILLSYFSQLLTKIYPACANKDAYGCFVIDKGGYMVVSNKNESNVLPSKHVTEVEPSIASALIRDGVLKTMSCSNLESGYLSRSYQIPDTQERHSAITGNLPCKKFQIIPVKTTNVYIVILIKQHVNCPSLTNRPCTCRNWIDLSCSSPWTGDFCECPCTAHNPFYQSCLNKYLSNSPPPCSPPLTSNELDFTAWRKTKKGAFDQPRCFQQSFDFKYAQSKTVSNSSKTSKILAGVFVFLIVAIVGAGIYFIYRRRKLRSSQNTEPKVPLGTGIRPTAAPSAQYQIYPELPPYNSSPSTLERSLPETQQPTATNIEKLYVNRRTVPERSPRLSSRPPPTNPSYESAQLSCDETISVTPTAPEIVTWKST